MKYHNKKVIVNGIKFDSKKEGDINGGKKIYI
ncbi:MAG: DUF1064 domain-containing protein [Bacilli bacterium]|nr:DUF1064 domain-containing protein [Bacilli bacterium]